MKNNILKSILFTATFGALVACEEQIFPELESAEPVLVIDAWVTNRDQPQVIKITRSQPYFDEVLPTGVAGASVSVSDNLGNVFTFTEGATQGEYVWTPVGNVGFGTVGNSYELTVTVNGETFLANARMNDVPPVDSITFNKQEGTQFFDDLYFAEFWGTDLLPVGDAYWIKTYKNGQLLNKPSEISLAYDAAFSRGADYSGEKFITPIRTSINPFDEGADGSLLSPYSVGDSLYVEINSLSQEAFDFLTEVQLQTDRPGGFGELFSTPIANVPTNVRNVNASGSKVVGFFNVAAVAGNGRRFKSLDEVSRVY
ncbi:DUF4249 domain-containing protein [Chryseotalea sanaruensis]|uniref:DUF4249 domain-containing protein n=1 Tax=Chryseotalea sanaruensis TaxID=2482724 RepID=A0A401U4T4_9BACT|nr:DUF4249 domain-containing protein [Chryseotalea sanaruensis]GCC49892.1 DUF4249 domain-containing protein [Chryseotalea sanaruensis]